MEFLTCAEAAAARRSDYTIARMPAGEPVPRDPRTLQGGTRALRFEAVTPGERSDEVPRVRHASPAWRHGTTTGYLRGCRRAGDCPGGADGLTCVDARNASRRRSARAKGIPPREPSVDVSGVAGRIRRLASEGRSLREIARSCGVGRTTITGIAGGTVLRVNPATFGRILESLDVG
ncbi:hypothetical protein GCM10025773_23770 [Microbacterium jejuense]